MGVRLRTRLIAVGIVASLVSVSSPAAGSRRQDSRGRAPVNGKVLFFAYDGTDWGLWRTDGTEQGTSIIERIQPTAMWKLGSSAYFATYEGACGSMLWRTDGTPQGTVSVKCVRFGPRRTSYSGGLTVAGRAFYFNANDGKHGYELWKSDGTPGGTVMVKNINPDRLSDPHAMSTIGDEVYFRADDGVHGSELWKSDGTTRGTKLVRDIAPGSTSSVDLWLNGWTFGAGALMYFMADDRRHGFKTWRTDGTERGTFMLRDVGPGNPVMQGDGLLYLTMYDHGFALWRSDGTLGGTRPLLDLAPDPAAGGYVSPIGALHGGVLFSADDGDTGNELWWSDGSPAGTKLVLDIRHGPASSGPGGSVVVLAGDRGAYFSANDGVNGSELWRSDGTHRGTGMVADLRPGRGGSAPIAGCGIGGVFFFTADDGVSGRELWRTDGTVAGTVPVADIWAGPQGSTPESMLCLSG